MKITTIASKSYTTHIPMLIKVLGITSGPVLELGGGLFSTPLLHWLCAESRRPLETYENYPQYFKFAKYFQSRNHKVNFVEDWNKLNPKGYFSVVFIDHGPAKQREIDAIKLKNQADYIILHDSQVPEEYGYDKVWQHFKYRYDWNFCTPWTSVISNYKDLTILKNE